MLSYRESVAQWYERRFNVKLDPENEVLSLIGSKEGIGHIPLAFVNSGDIVLCPSPAYPVYSIGTLFADGEPYFMPLLGSEGFLPDFSSIPEGILKRTKMLFLNYPNNPTSATAGEDFFKKAVETAHQYGIIICHDAAYSEIYYDDKKPISFLEIDGAKEVGIEVHSLSKTYSMTGWRIGFAVGNSEVIAGLGKIKTNLDSGAFQAIQEASITALNTSDAILSNIRMSYQSRRDVLFNGLVNLNLVVQKPEATFYLWARVPSGFTSEDFTGHLLDRGGVLVTPGNGFGDPGEGYVRFALTVSTERLEEAVDRIRKVL
jgi:LL-diaminopimelate aminotransferase